VLIGEDGGSSGIGAWRGAKQNQGGHLVAKPMYPGAKKIGQHTGDAATHHAIKTTPKMGGIKTKVTNSGRVGWSSGRNKRPFIINP
jgi:hypothetical protein